MFCTGCGKPLEDGVAFCPNCGKPVDGAALAAVGGEQRVEVPQPVDGVEPAATDCDGQDVEILQPVGDAQPQPKAKSRRNLFIGLGAACAVVAVGLAAYLFMFFNADVDIANAFSDEGMRAVVEHVADGDGDGKLSKDEAAAVTYIDLAQEGTDVSEVSGLSDFPNLASIDAVDVPVSSIDLSGCTSLQYLDLRGSKVTELDLSDCPSIQSVYCNPDVKVETGKNDYATEDLLTSAAVTMASNGKAYGTSTLNISYDGEGRMIKANDRTYSYDGQGRLSSVSGPPAARNNGSQTSGSNSDMTITYAYDENGRVVSRNLICADSSVSKTEFDSSLQWNADGMLESSHVESIFGYTGQQYSAYDRSLSYVGSVLAKVDENDELIANQGSSSSTVKTTTYSKNAAGQLSGCDSNATSSYNGKTSTSASAEQYSYDDQGYCTSVAKTTSGGSPTTSTVEYDAEGKPVEMQVNSTSLTTYCTFECNEDGYPTKVTSTGGTADTFNGTTVALTYVQHVSGASQDASHDNLPHIRLADTSRFSAATSEWWDTFFEPTNGGYLYFLPCETDPITNAINGTGCAPQIFHLGRPLGIVS